MTNQDTAVAVIEQSAEEAVVEWNLDSFPTDRFNRLIPTQTISMPTDLFRPVVQVVQLDPVDREGKSPDTYKSSDVPNGHRALTARALNKLATAAAVSFLEERRIDDGADPDVIGVSVLASMVLPTGQRITAPGSQLINIRTWFSASQSEAEKAKFRKQFYAHVSTRAKNRAIRGLLSLRSSYPDAEVAKPFAVVSYVPNMAHPEVRARVLDAMVPVAAQLYGSAPQAIRQLDAGTRELTAPEAPEEDPAPATPPTLPGEKLAAAASTSSTEEPEWMRSSEPAKASKPAKVDFATSIRDSAAAGSDELASPDAFALLREIFAGFDGRLVGAGIHVLFDDEATGPQEPNRLSAGQVEAIVLVHESLGHEKFETHWRSLVDASTKAAA